MEIYAFFLALLAILIFTVLGVFIISVRWERKPANRWNTYSKRFHIIQVLIIFILILMFVVSLLRLYFDYDFPWFVCIYLAFRSALYSGAAFIVIFAYSRYTEKKIKSTFSSEEKDIAPENKNTKNQCCIYEDDDCSNKP